MPAIRGCLDALHYAGSAGLELIVIAAGVSWVMHGGDPSDTRTLYTMGALQIATIIQYPIVNALIDWATRPKYIEPKYDNSPAPRETSTYDVREVPKVVDYDTARRIAARVSEAYNKEKGL